MGVDWLIGLAGVSVFFLKEREDDRQKDLKERVEAKERHWRG